ncbi:MAG: DNA internalization-related competence protein ComEC/Rec2 [Candidatus Hydrogenedentes bacterium]|nr:DNA internalization-related competence protein ComEC/Rec2 [Candidatus Hydrogenedentota bacterium]
MNRPVAVAASFFLFGLLFASFAHVVHVWLPCLVLFSGLTCSILAQKRRALRLLTVALVFSGSGGFIWVLHHADGPGDPFSRIAETYHDVPVEIEGHVLQAGLVNPKHESITLIVAVDRYQLSDGVVRQTEGNVLVRWIHPDKQPYCGERVRVRGQLSVTIAQVNPGIGGVETYYRLQNVHSMITAADLGSVERISEAPLLSPAYWASRLRAALATRLAAVMPKQILPFVYAVWLGERSSLSEGEFQSYVESGTAHILSVSGVHVSIIFLSADFVLGLFIRSRRTRATLSVLIVLLYALMTGASTPSVRAALMVCIYLAAEFVDRDPDTPTALSIAALVFLVWNPDLVFDVGFQLSFLSLASILVFSAPLQNGLDALRSRIVRTIRKKRVPDAESRAWQFLRAPVATTLSVQILPVPMAVRAFHVFSVSAPFSNLLIIPLLTAVLWLCFAASIFCWFSPALAQIFGHAAGPAIILIQRVADWSRVSYAVTTPTPTAVALLWSGAFAWLTVGSALGASRKWFRGTLATGLLVLSLVFWRPLFPEPEIVFLDVGHGDSAFLCFPGGGTALIDAGDKVKNVDYGKRIVTPFLLSRGLTHLDLLFVSHSDSDHIGGALTIVDRFSVGAVILGPHPSDNPMEQDLIGRCNRRGIPVRRTTQGDTWKLGSGTFDVLYPSAGQAPEKGTNENSLVLRVHFGNLSILFPGDVEDTAESKLADIDCRCDILKVPHHGSATSSTPAFLNRAAPKAAVVSTGGRQGSEPVDDTVMLRYREREIPVWRTDYEGAIRVRYRRNSLVIEGEREIREYPMPRTN